jgi:hypothetical protein
LKIPDFITILPLFGNPFKNAHTTLEFMERWGKMEDAGFDYRQLNYIIRNYEDPKKLLGPTQKTILQLAKNLYDGINAIETSHKDIKAGDDITIENIRSETILLFDQSVVEKIAGLIEGTNVFTTNAPKNLAITIAEEKSLKKKLKYDKNAGNIQVTGILTAAETIDYKALSNDPKWVESLTRIEKQQNKLFKEILSDVFETEKKKSPERRLIVEEAEKILKAGDLSMAFENIPEGGEDPNSAPKKRLAFINVFMPYLRQQLTHRFIVETVSGIAGLEKEITDALISEVLRIGTPLTPVYSVFEAIKESARPDNMNWSGYLIPSASGQYSFIIRDSDSKPVLGIDGAALTFTAQEDPTNEWWSSPQKLQAGKLYNLSVSGIDLKNLNWKSATSSITTIPSSSLLPDFAAANCGPAFIMVVKAAILVNVFELSADEILYLDQQAMDFGDMNFNALTLEQWLRLEAYSRLRNSLPSTKTNILEFFKWTHHPDDASKLSEKISELTGWKKERIVQLIATSHFNLQHPDAFLNEKDLLKLQKAIVIADKIGMNIDLLFDWAKPTSNFKKCRGIADNIQKAIRAQYTQEDWEQVVKPLNDKLRENQKNALIAYLLQQPDLIKWGVVDADGLFEYFLIDVQMDACMETSRIKQAISSVQLFIQRCFLGLEKEHNGIAPDILDRGRWDWMQRYRVWEANRKVFLYPENWIESNLRDDKSTFFKEMEGQLLQNDINKQNVEDALKAYLYKVDEVSNMQVVGLYLDGEKNAGGTWKEGSKLHVFSRTRNAPYFFYYRYLAIDQANWCPWEKMQVDIPCYDLEDHNNHQIDSNGCFLIPVVWTNRLLVFFPEFIKKTKPSVDSNVMPAKPDGSGNITVSKPTEYWEMKMGWSEYRNGRWTPKQISADAIYESPVIAIDKFRFAPNIVTGANPRLLIQVFPGGSALREFAFSGSQIFSDPDAPFDIDFPGPSSFHINTTTHEIHSLQTVNAAPRPIAKTEPFFAVTNNNVELTLNGTKTKFRHPFVHELLSKANMGELQQVFEYNLSAGIDKTDAYGGFDHDNDAATPNVYHELKKPYSIYNWELFFHTPMMLADALSKGRQFEDAMKWYHYVFSPMASGTDDKRFWRFSPFKDIEAQSILEAIFNHLKPNQSDQAINEWRENPFKPHLVARSRPVAYMKWTVMKYLDNLIAWGDYLYRQDTIESINQATQLYILAIHILGPRPQMIPKRGKIKPQTYLSLLDKWDAFSNAMVELELVAPFSNQITTPIASSNGVTGLANIFGFASTLYFCIPNNPKLMGYWDIISDRLFKIRHCENIEGVFRKLPLFEPPIDPALLVKAAAQGLSIDSVLNDLNSPMPNYRFYYLLQKALELCGELKTLGGSMLMAIEKNDNENLLLIRAKHETTMQNLMMEIKKQQLEEATKTLESLEQNRKGPEYRMQHYLQLVGEDMNKVPGATADFNAIANQLEKPLDESGLKVNSLEKEEMDKALEANDKQEDVGRQETLGSILNIIPTFSGNIEPFGIGMTMSFGGSNLGAAAQASARAKQVVVANRSFSSANAQRKSGYLRQFQDRVLQANSAGYEIKQIDKQIVTQQIRINIVNQEIGNQQKLIDHALEIEDFLKSKYTKDELYTWMKGSLRSLYHQVYSVAYELAKKAEKLYGFERGLTNTNFIQAGYFDAGRDGLLSGEQLYLGLKQLEAAYLEQRGYDYEVSKHISLRKVNPLAILQLRETGKCEFILPEVLFDMDYPGHFKRRIKSVSVSIPCIGGPHTGLNGTLRLLENKFRNTAIAKDKTDYLEKTDAADERFNSYIIPIASIAASSAQNDSGMFELNFRDERYLPFEGAGVISKWSLELPSFRQFDYDTISDVVVHMRYTSVEGGERLKKAGADAVLDFIKTNEELAQQEGVFAIIDLQHDTPNQWHQAMQVKEGDTERVVLIKSIQDFLPYYVSIDKSGAPRDPKKIIVTDVILVTHSDLQPSEVSIVQGENEIQFMNGIPVGLAKSFAIRDEEIKMGDWKLTIKNTHKEIDKALMVVRFVVK